ncbi:C40 family peptidase [Bacteroides sp.]
MKISILFISLFWLAVSGMKAQEIRAISADSAYAVVNVSVCNMRSEGKFTSGMVTQALMGMPVKVLQYTDWYEIQTPDDYTGWVHRMVITPMSKEAYDDWNRAEKIVVTAHYGFTYEKPNEHTQTVSDVVAGNRLKWEGSKGHFYEVSYPDGRLAYIPKSIAKPEKEWRSKLKQDAQSIVRTAYTMMGIPYLWAGTSPKGVDCSGLVRTVLFMHDIIIPRDASQQAYVGQHIDIAPDFDNIEPGDLVFFGRKAVEGKKENVSHVGIYVGDKKFIHALGDVHISSFSPEDKEYDVFNTERLLYAVRFLPYINKEKELNTTLTNPYYNSVTE